MIFRATVALSDNSTVEDNYDASQPSQFIQKSSGSCTAGLYENARIPLRLVIVFNGSFVLIRF